MTKPNRDIFVTTRWSMVLEAAHCDAQRARTALEDLCGAYWFPLYAYVRRRGYGPHDAEDLTQGFFARILKLNSLAKIDRERGKFRAFLLASMNHFIADEWDKASAQKRAAQQTISLDAELAENRYRNEPMDRLSPERVFERRWAMTLLENVVQRLRAEYEAAGQGALFMEARFAISGDKNAVPYAELASRIGMKEEALRVAVYRLRKRYRQALHEAISQTVEKESDIEDELNDLRRILSS